VDTWYQLEGEAMISLDSQGATPPQTHPHYLLTQRSLEQWLTHIQAMAVVSPDYYRDALRRRTEAERRRRQLLSLAWKAEKYLEREHAGQFLQTEYLSFLLTALVETAQYASSKQPGEHDGPVQGRDPHVE